MDGPLPSDPDSRESNYPFLPFVDWLLNPQASHFFAKLKKEDLNSI
jgi:hypothetical protein